MKNNLTQSDLANNIGVSRQMINRYENGFNVPPLFYATKISNYFNVDINWLMNDENIGDSKRNNKLTVSRLNTITFLEIFISFLVWGLFFFVKSFKSFL